MNKLEPYLDYYYKEKGYNCAETTLCAANEAWDLNLPENAMRLVGGYGGGMGCAIVCGAVSGGIAALSYKFVEESGHKCPFLMRNVRGFVKRVREELGDENCKVLHSKYFSKDEKCLLTIKLVAQILDETYDKMLNEKESGLWEKKLNS